MIAGASAGLISSIVTCPLDVMKTTLQAQGASVPIARTAKFVDEGIFGQHTCSSKLRVFMANHIYVIYIYILLIVATVSRIWHGEGLRGFYRGLGPTIYGYLPTWGIYFTVYDRVKYHLSSAEPDSKQIILCAAFH